MNVLTFLQSGHSEQRALANLVKARQSTKTLVRTELVSCFWERTYLN